MNKGLWNPKVKRVTYGQVTVFKGTEDCGRLKDAPHPKEIRSEERRVGKEC